VGQYEATKKKSPETTNNRLARGSYRGSTRLLAQGSSGGAVCHRGSGSHLPAQGSSGGAGSHLLTQGNSGSACIPWNPAAASRRRAAPGAPRVTAAPDPMKTAKLSSSENRALDDFFSTHRLTQSSSGGSACPHGSGPNENRRADAEDLADPGRCKATPIRS
jgi:hypothetical protein